MLKTAYFDPFSGASGDMTLGALVDAGVSIRALRAELRKLGLGGYTLSAKRIERSGIGATKIAVKVRKPRHGHRHPHRHLADILGIIDAADLPETDRERAGAVFRRLAEAEAHVHCCGVDEIHFHEVGAVDAIVDIVGAVVGLRLLGVERVVCGPIRTGTGFVDCAHGRLPLPAPATAQLLRDVPSIGTDVEGELTTPTGAALLTTLADAFGPRPPMAVRAVGYGAGDAERDGPPNLLRLFVGDAVTPAEGLEEADQVVILEANLDDLSAEIAGHVMERILDAGALDCFFTPIQMKKNRPGVLLTALVEPARSAAIEELLLTETSTFGLRRTLASRRKLRREWVEVKLKGGTVRIKLGHLGDRLVHAAPEYEDCRALAARRRLPLKAVYEAALDAFRRR